MAKKLDKIVVIDVEATCWPGSPPHGERQEIIEVGVVLFDVKKLLISNKESLIVRPDFSKVSKFCTELTTLTQADVDKGITFAEACHILKKEYQTESRTFASYGDFDRKAFERDCIHKNVKFPFGPTHLNIKNLFAIAFSLEREIGMAEALKKMNLPLIGTHHRGHDDAENIAKILRELILKFDF